MCNIQKLIHNKVSFSLGGIIILTMYLLGNISRMMSYSWYNLIPTNSFNLDNYIFSSDIINEIEYVDNSIGVVDNSFGLGIIIGYDLLWLICFYMIGRDYFNKADY